MYEWNDPAKSYLKSWRYWVVCAESAWLQKAHLRNVDPPSLWEEYGELGYVYAMRAKMLQRRYGRN